MLNSAIRGSSYVIYVSVTVLNPLSVHPSLLLRHCIYAFGANKLKILSKAVTSNDNVNRVLKCRCRRRGRAIWVIVQFERQESWMSTILVDCQKAFDMGNKNENQSEVTSIFSLDIEPASVTISLACYQTDTGPGFLDIHDKPLQI